MDRPAKEPVSSSGAIFALALLNLFSFGIDSGGMGFYLDDWSLAEPAWRAADQGLWGMMKEFHRAGAQVGTSWLLRPLDILYHPGMYWLAGLSFWKYQAAYRAMETASAAMIFLGFLSATGRAGPSFLTACLFMVFPNHGATHHWFTAVATPAMAFASAGLWTYARWLESGRVWALAAGLALLAAGSLTYEAVLPVAVLMPFLSYWRGLRRGLGRGEALRKAAADAVWPALAVAALAAYHVGIQRWGPPTISRRLGFDLGFMLKSLVRGVECNSTGVLHLCFVFTRQALAQLEWWRWPAAALGAAALVLWLRSRFAEELRWKDPVAASWAAAGGVLLVGAHAPYAFSADRYVPHVFDAQNRLNVPPSLAAVMLLGLGLTMLPGRVRSGVLAAVLAVFTIANWENARQWKEAYRLERQVLAALQKHVDRLPPGQAVIALEGAPELAGTAPVFNEVFTFDSALRLSTGRKDLFGTLLRGGNAPRPRQGIEAWYRYSFPEDRFSVWEPGKP